MRFRILIPHWGFARQFETSVRRQSFPRRRLSEKWRIVVPLEGIAPAMPWQRGSAALQKTSSSVRLAHAVLLVSLCIVAVQPALAADARELDRKASAALAALYKQSPAAKQLSAKAKAVLVFPDIVKGGFIVGGQIGDGVLRVDAKTMGYYRSVAASYGLQAGIQSFGYALMFMDPESLAYLHKSDGWEIGVGPSIVVVDEGAAKSLSTTTLQSGVYAFIFSQKGLMAGVGLQGAKITKITPGQ